MRIQAHALQHEKIHTKSKGSLLFIFLFEPTIFKYVKLEILDEHPTKVSFAFTFGLKEGVGRKE